MNIIKIFKMVPCRICIDKYVNSSDRSVRKSCITFSKSVWKNGSVEMQFVSPDTRTKICCNFEYTFALIHLAKNNFWTSGRVFMNPLKVTVGTFLPSLIIVWQHCRLGKVCEVSYRILKFFVVLNLQNM